VIRIEPFSNLPNDDQNGNMQNNDKPQNEEEENESGQMDVDSVPGFEELERRFKALKNPV